MIYNQCWQVMYYQVIHYCNQTTTTKRQWDHCGKTCPHLLVKNANFFTK